MTVLTTAGVATLNAIVKDVSQAYINLHTTVNPGGAIRDQLAGPAAKPNVLGVTATASTITIAAPGSILSINGTGLATFTSGLSGFSALTKLPTSLNGVTMTIGGKDAAVVYSIASPGFAGLYQTAVRVPDGVSGSDPLVLKIGAGSSNSVTSRYSNPERYLATIKL